MKKIILNISLLLLSVTNVLATPPETMYTYAEGMVFPCMNEEVNPFGTCFMIGDQNWGLVTPNFDPKPGEKVYVRFTLKRMLNMPRDHEDKFYVSLLELTASFNPPKVIQQFIPPNKYNEDLKKYKEIICLTK